MLVDVLLYKAQSLFVVTSVTYIEYTNAPFSESMCSVSELCSFGSNSLSRTVALINFRRGAFDGS